MTPASIAELAGSCSRRQVLDCDCPIIAETAADRMAGGAGSPVTPTFLVGSFDPHPVAIVWGHSRRDLTAASSGSGQTCSPREPREAEGRLPDDPAIRSGQLWLLFLRLSPSCSLSLPPRPSPAPFPFACAPFPFPTDFRQNLQSGRSNDKIAFLWCLTTF